MFILVTMETETVSLFVFSCLLNGAFRKERTYTRALNKGTFITLTKRPPHWREGTILLNRDTQTTWRERNNESDVKAEAIRTNKAKDLSKSTKRIQERVNCSWTLHYFRHNWVIFTTFIMKNYGRTHIFK